MPTCSRCGLSHPSRGVAWDPVHRAFLCNACWSVKSKLPRGEAKINQWRHDHPILARRLGLTVPRDDGGCTGR